MKIEQLKPKLAVIIIAIVVVLLAVAIAIWWATRAPKLPVGFIESSGRIEATEVDIATKIPARITDIFVKEGDFVKSGQVLAQMDIRNLQEQLAEAKAQISQAESSLISAQSSLAQRQSEKVANEAMVRRREAELKAAQNAAQNAAQKASQNAAQHDEEKCFKDSTPRVKKGAVSAQQRDAARKLAISKGTLEAAKAEVMAAQAGIEATNASIIQAKAQLEAAQATERRILADIGDSELKAPRSGRIQNRLAKPGEELDVGGRVLNLVDISNVYMTFFLSTEDAGKVVIGSEVHIVLDAAPNMVIPAKVSDVESVVQSSSKTVETNTENLKQMFRVKARVAAELLEKYPEQVKTGLPGKAYVRLDSNLDWPEQLKVRLP